MPGFIDDMMEKVDKVLREHIPEMRDRAELETFLEGRPRPRGQYARRTHDELVVDFNQICDKLAASLRERDQLREQVSGLKRRLDILNLKLWIVIGVSTAEAAMILFLARELFSRLH